MQEAESPAQSADVASDAFNSAQSDSEVAPGDGESLQAAFERELSARAAHAQQGAPEPAPAEPAAESEPAAEPNRTQARASVALRRREQALAQREREAQSELAEARRVKQEWDERKTRGKSAWFSYVKELGFENPRQFLEHVAQDPHGGMPTPQEERQTALERRLAEYERKETDRARADSERQAETARRENIDRWHSHIANYVKTSDAHKSGLVSLPGAEQMAFQVIADHYRESDGEELPLEDALATVGKQIEGQFSGVLNTMAQSPQGRAMIEEFATKLIPQDGPPATRTKRPQAQTNPSSRLAATRPTTQSNRPRDDETLEERRDRAAAWLTEISQNRRGM